MRISKHKKVQADTGLEELEVVTEPEVVEVVEELPEALETECIVDRACALDHIQQAIDCLSDCANSGDEEVKNYIADLSVIYFELQ